ncbi:MAG: nuclear transport factor 2 family protein [Anaerolineales bacterium]|nr:nuclear transport factor 2 family protein [Anaerolineales bacterium]
MDATEAVCRVNDRFYIALSLADFAAMERLWVNSADAVCIHPGWPPLYGWEAIRESWREIFRHQGPLHIWATETRVRIFGQTAEVHCLENIDTGQIAGFALLQTRAVNVFRAVGATWKILEHHAAPAQTRPQRPARFSSN